MLFRYPEGAAFNRVVPKNKIYAHGRASNRLKQLFVDQVSKITWRYKLSTPTTNLPSLPTVPEIQIFEIVQKEESIKDDVLRCIDNAIQFPIVFELCYEDAVKSKAAFKRPSESGSMKWVVSEYFESNWQPADSQRDPLPVSLDLPKLYDQMLRRLMPFPARDGESLKAHVERLSAARIKEGQCSKLEARMKVEKQFNRKVQINATLREIRHELDGLIR